MYSVVDYMVFDLFMMQTMNNSIQGNTIYCILIEPSTSTIDLQSINVQVSNRIADVYFVRHYTLCSLSVDRCVL